VDLLTDPRFVVVINGSRSIVSLWWPSGRGASQLSIRQEGVLSTTDLWNGAVHPGFAPGPNGLGPAQVLYDPGAGQLLVFNQVTDSISFVDPATGAVVGGLVVGPPDYWAPLELSENSSGNLAFVLNTARDAVDIVNVSTERISGTVSLGSTPLSLAFDSSNGYLYVSLFHNSTLVQIDPTSDSVTRYIPSGEPSVYQTLMLGYDPFADRLIVANEASDNISIIDPTNASVTQRLVVGYEPNAIAIDQPNDRVWIANYLSANVSELNATSLQLLGSVPVGSYPDSLAVAGSDRAFVASYLWDNLTAVNTTTGTVVGSVGTGSIPWGLTWDPVNDHLYACNNGNDNLTVITSPTNLTPIRSIAIGAAPGGPAYDARDNLLLVPQLDTGNLTLLNASNGQLVGAILIGPSVTSVAFDPIDDRAFVTEPSPSYGENGIVSVINISSRTIIANITVGVGPNAAVWDSETDQVYIVNSQSVFVTAIEGSNPISTTTIPLPSNALGGANEPSGLALDPSLHELIVSKLATESGFAIVNTSTDVVVSSTVTAGAIGEMAVDPVSNLLFASEVSLDEVAIVDLATGRVIGNLSTTGGPGPVDWSSMSNEVYVADATSNLTTYNATTFAPEGTIPVGSVPRGFAFDPGANVLTVALSPQGTLVRVGALPQYPVLFNESGLPAGTSWGVRIAGNLNNGTSATLAFQLANGTYLFTVVTPPGFVAAPPGGSMTVNGSAVDRSVVFSVHTYSWVVQERGLPVGTPWYSNFSGSSGIGRYATSSSSVVAHLANGTYTLTSSSGDPRWVAASGGIAFTVDGTGGNLSVIFSLMAFGADATAAGLPVGTLWAVNFTGPLGSWQNSSRTGQLFEALPNGSYTYRAWVPAGGWQAEPPIGTLAISGSPYRFEINFTQVVYPVNFHAVGLPLGVAWFVNFSNSSSARFTGTEGTLLIPNGTYHFQVTSADGRWAPTVSSGSFTVTAASKAVEIVFHELFEVEFAESGLPSRTSWSATLNGTTKSGSGPITFTGVVNGTYPFTIPSILPYNAVPSSGNISVKGANSTATITFFPLSGTRAPPPNPATFLGLPQTEGYALLGGIVAVIVVAAAVTGLRHRRKAAPNDSAQPTHDVSVGEPPARP